MGSLNGSSFIGERADGQAQGQPRGSLSIYLSSFTVILDHVLFLGFQMIVSHVTFWIINSLSIHLKLCDSYISPRVAPATNEVPLISLLGRLFDGVRKAQVALKGGQQTVTLCMYMNSEYPPFWYLSSAIIVQGWFIIGNHMGGNERVEYDDTYARVPVF